MIQVLSIITVLLVLGSTKLVVLGMLFVVWSGRGYPGKPG